MLKIFFLSIFLLLFSHDLIFADDRVCSYLPIVRKFTKAYPYYLNGRKPFRINPKLILAIIRQESAGDSRATSRVGARGLMQIMPKTARLLGADPARLYEVEYNVRYGVMFMAALLSEHHGDIVKAISSYNGGSYNTRKKSISDPSFKGRIYDNRETRNYVSRVLNYFEHYKLIGCR